MNLLSTSIVLALLLSSAAVAQDNWDGVPLKVYQTSRDNAGDRLTDKGTITLQAGANPSGVHSMIQINTATQYQKILGFGGAFTEASAYVYSTLNDNLKRQVAELFFGPDGIQYSLCRTHINSCDFSLSSYSFDDTPGDFTLSRFDISHARERMLPFIKDCIAKSNRTVNIFASPWSPPAWMKGNNAMPGSSYPGLLADTRVHDAWALYFSKFITAYENEGVPIWGITVQNEPEFAAPWEACVYSAEQQRDFIKNHLGPRMRADHPDKKIMIFDHNKDHVFNWVNTIMSDPAASQYVHGTGFHWYGGQHFDNLWASHNAFPDKFLLATEACNCPGVILGDWGRAENYAVNMIGDLNSWSIGWTDWNMLLDMGGGPHHLGGPCDAHLVGDAAAQVLHIQPSYYYYGHLSKYFLPGSVRVDLQCMQMNGAQQTGGCPLSAVAALNEDKTLVVTVLNTGDAQQTVSINIAGSQAQYTMPGHSMATFKGTNVQPPTSAATTDSTDTTSSATDSTQSSADTTATSADTTATSADTSADTTQSSTDSTISSSDNSESQGLVTDPQGEVATATTLSQLSSYATAFFVLFWQMI